MPTKILPVPYHRQLGAYYCGPACLQMVIEALGLKSKNQDTLYIDAHGHGPLDPKTNWYSPPDGVEWTLDAILGRKWDYDVCALTSEAALTRRLVWSLFNKAAPIALVYGYTHWVVVVGYDIDRDPTGPTDAGYEIRALEIHDPSRAGEKAGPPPPPPPRHVAYREWLRTYLDGVPSGYWEAKVVAVGDFGISDQVAVDEPPPIAPSSDDKEKILSLDAAQEAALKGLEQYGLLKRKEWGALLASPIEARTPLLVQRLDVVDDYYYLVPIGQGDGPVSTGVRVDAFSGEYLETSAFATTGEGLWGSFVRNWRSDDDARRQIAGRRFELPNRGGRVLARPEGIGIHPSFVWKPCVESLSPFYPFRLLTIGDTRRYVRLDGEVFDGLHEGGPGM